MRPAIRTHAELDQVERQLRDALAKIRADINSFWAMNQVRRSRAMRDDIGSLSTKAGTLEVALRVLDRERALGALREELAEHPSVRRVGWSQDWAVTGEHASMAPVALRLDVLLADGSLHRVTVAPSVPASALRESILKMLAIDLPNEGSPADDVHG